MFNINFDKVVYQLSPESLRKPNIDAWLKVLVSQVKSLYNTFLVYRTDTLNKIAYTGQIIYLEKVLNDKFDNVTRSIYINNIADVSRNWLYNKIEQKPKLYVYNKAEAHLPNKYLKNGAEYNSQNDFIVMVRVTLTFDQNEMKGLVNLYKLAGKRYTIQTY